MIRDYGFHLADLPFDADGLLPRDKTPKQAWAEHHPDLFPVEINQASRTTLLRVPGIGPRSAERIINIRRQTTLRDIAQLTRLGITATWAAPYILLDGRRVPFQQKLW